MNIGDTVGFINKYTERFVKTEITGETQKFWKCASGDLVSKENHKQRGGHETFKVLNKGDLDEIAKMEITAAEKLRNYRIKESERVGKLNMEKIVNFLDYSVHKTIGIEKNFQDAYNIYCAICELLEMPNRVNTLRGIKEDTEKRISLIK